MKRIRFGLVFGILALVVSACGAADDGQTGSDEPIDEVVQEMPNGTGTTGGSCTIEKCNGILDPFGKLQCTAGGMLCVCVHGTTTAGCQPGNASNCTQTCTRQNAP